MYEKEFKAFFEILTKDIIEDLSCDFPVFSPSTGGVQTLFCFSLPVSRRLDVKAFTASLYGNDL